jgi:DNA-binding transcriptional ArsR family regulator
MLQTAAMEDRTFDALADPTRRRIIELLAGGELTAGEIAERFPVSRPAISRHLRVLRESGLVACRGEAQRRLYTLKTEPLAEVDAWLGRCRAFRRNGTDPPAGESLGGFRIQRPLTADTSVHLGPQALLAGSA